MYQTHATTPNIFKRNGLLTIREAALHSGISRSMLYELEKEGLRMIRFTPKKVFIRMTDLDEFIQKRIEKQSA